MCLRGSGRSDVVRVASPKAGEASIHWLDTRLNTGVKRIKQMKKFRLFTIPAAALLGFSHVAQAAVAARYRQSKSRLGVLAMAIASVTSMSAFAASDPQTTTIWLNRRTRPVPARTGRAAKRSPGWTYSELPLFSAKRHKDAADIPGSLLNQTWRLPTEDVPCPSPGHKRYASV